MAILSMKTPVKTSLKTRCAATKTPPEYLKTEPMPSAYSIKPTHRYCRMGILPKGIYTRSAEQRAKLGGARKGSGRPKQGPRCQCGAMGLKRALQIRHKCADTKELQYEPFSE